MFSLADRRRAAAVFLSLAGVAALSACSDSPDPGANAAQSPSASASETASSPSPSPSPSATYKPASADGPAENVPLPVMPEEAKVESKEGLIAFARHWYEVANYAYQTGDVEPMKAISGPDCTACNGVYSALERWYEGDKWLAGSLIDIDSIASEYAQTETGERQALIMFAQVPIQSYGPEGLIDTTGEGDTYVQLLNGRYEDGSWIAYDIVTMKKLP
ncbi:DUF6318 family protein [Arthrobacter sp. zg-Y916]|uniref:DUF6318 family protein n=1 Tax=Arthrobacter caoxuetaonis TaxID=2886935 RepID=A0A9X1MCE5_9MICC|nr:MULTISPECIES: DUF6318 family protein [Arthrobacter]MCC3297383.1 DUF6318 family protein [Arthrobacter caoxuetaonis]MCC9194273.1 DUF6318 family protein [Arthrobacter sp. zg-Y916]USQ58082.1 DUF6318 family protein [Arthrobacter caoxuetaonis]